ncbi:MAG: hypothetical protein U0790_25110 [Isosphaeraceae bacterium]
MRIRTVHVSYGRKFGSLGNYQSAAAGVPPGPSSTRARTPRPPRPS